MNSDASDFVLPNPDRQAECMAKALRKANLEPGQIDLISTHATATPMGDAQEIMAIRKVFGDSAKTYINNTKSFIGHAMGSIGVLELAGNLPSFVDNVIHPTINCEDLDPECDMSGLVIGTPKTVERVEYILNNSFGMVGINSVVIVKK
jgi:3-oxoacyl-[acyl-carrier-protein] synthase II